MTSLGKVLVFVNLAFSVVVATWALGHLQRPDRLVRRQGGQG